MAEIVVIEPDPAVETLLVELIRCAGHDPRVYRAPRDLHGADVVVLEPEHAAGFEAVRRAQTARRVPVICVSITDKDTRAASLGASFLAKPFASRSLLNALAAALHTAA